MGVGGNKMNRELKKFKSGKKIWDEACREWAAAIEAEEKAR